MCPSNYNRFWDRARYWSKIVIFHTPLHSTHSFGGSRRNIATPFGIGKTRMVWLPDGKKNFEDMFIRFAMIHKRDGQTDGHRITAYTALMHKHRAVKTGNDFVQQLNRLLWVEKRQTSLHHVWPPNSPDLKSWIVNLSCSIDRVYHRFTVWTNWNGGWSTFDAVLNSPFLMRLLTLQWRGQHRECVRAKLGQFEYNLWTDNVDFVHICYIHVSCLTVSMPATIANTHSCLFYKVPVVLLVP